MYPPRSDDGPSSLDGCYHKKSIDCWAETVRDRLARARYLARHASLYGRGRVYPSWFASFVHVDETRRLPRDVHSPRQTDTPSGPLARVSVWRWATSVC